MSKKVRFSPNTKGFCTFVCPDEPDRQNERPRANETLNITELDQYCYPPEQKECYVKDKSEKGRPRIRQSLKKQRRTRKKGNKTRNRFATKDDGKTSRKILTQDFLDLFTSTEDRRGDRPSRNGYPVQRTKTEQDVDQSAKDSKAKKNGRESGKWTQPNATSPMKSWRNGSLSTGKRNGKSTSGNPGEIFEDTTTRHRQLAVKTHAKKRTQTVLRGKNRVQHREAVETVQERRSRLRIIPLSESNIRAKNLNRVPTRAEPGIEYNIFYLVSRYGDDISPLNAVNIDTMESTRRKMIPWSCSRAWFLCSVQKTGFPWSIRSKEDARGILTSSPVNAYRSDYILKQKLLDLSTARDFPGFVEREYSAYRECKFRTLHFVGYFSMKKYMKIHKERHTSGGLPYQSLKWENNSCALDAFLFVLPQICYSVISNGMYRSKIAGSDPCFHSPAACFFAALEAVSSEDMELSLASNWTRHLFMDIIQYTMPEHNMRDARASWSYFVRPQGYLDISSVLLYIPQLLGKGSLAFRNVQVPLVLEVSLYFTRETFEKSRQEEDFKSLGAFLLSSIVLAAEAVGDQIKESIYLFAFSFEDNYSSSMFKKWIHKMFLTSWNHDSKREESNQRLCAESEVSNNERTWRLETLGLIGRSTTTANHFVSLMSSSTSEDSVWVYDGLKENGQAKCMSKREAMSLSNSKVEMDGLFVLSALNLLR